MSTIRSKLHEILHHWTKDQYYLYDNDFDEDIKPYVEVMKSLGTNLSQKWLNVDLPASVISDIQNSIIDTTDPVLSRVREKILELGYNPGTVDMMLVEPLKHKQKLIGRINLQNTAF